MITRPRYSTEPSTELAIRPLVQQELNAEQLAELKELVGWREFIELMLALMFVAIENVALVALLLLHNTIHHILLPCLLLSAATLGFLSILQHRLWLLMFTIMGMNVLILYDVAIMIVDHVTHAADRQINFVWNLIESLLMIAAVLLGAYLCLIVAPQLEDVRHEAEQTQIQTTETVEKLAQVQPF